MMASIGCLLYCYRFPKNLQASRTKFGSKIRDLGYLPPLPSRIERFSFLSLPQIKIPFLPVRGMQNYFQQWNRGRDFPRLRASWTPIREREFFLIIARQQQNAYLSLSRPFLPSSLSLVEPSSLILSALIPPSLSNCFSPAIPLENWSTVELPVFGTRKMVDNSLEHVCASV